MSQSWSGIFPIILTPFTKGGEMDAGSLAKVVGFNIEAGARGLVGPAMASEFATLSDDERRKWIEVVVGEAGRQVPVIASVTSGHTLPAVALGRFAQEVGADGLMAMPPHIVHPDAEGCYSYYEALSAAVDIPICIQNHDAPMGTPMSSELLARMCEEISHVEYIKEEALPEPRRISLTRAAAGSACKGIFGGQGAIYLLDEYRRGAAGNMPCCHTTDVLVRIWDSLEAGDETAARTLFNQILPLINFERLLSMAVYKEVMFRRGIIATPVVRMPGGSLDRQDMAELDSILAGVEPLFSI